MDLNVLAKIKSQKKYMTGVESAIATLIVENPAEFVKMSMTQVSKKAGVSQGSIINFSNKFVKGGFSDLKLKICASFGEADLTDSTVVAKGDTLKEVLHKTIHSNVSAFRLTHEVNFEETLKSVATRIMNAKKVEIYGVYRSAAVATDFCYQLLELGIPASFVSDILTCSISATMLDKECLVIAISSSGKTKDIIDAVENAKMSGVPAVCITSNEYSPLAHICDDVLVASSDSATSENNAVQIRSSQILLTDALCAYIRSKTNIENKPRNAQLKRILNSHNIQEAENE